VAITAIKLISQNIQFLQRILKKYSKLPVSTGALMYLQASPSFKNLRASSIELQDYEETKNTRNAQKTIPII